MCSITLEKRMFKLFIFSTVLLFYGHITGGNQIEVNIGAIFFGDETDLSQAFIASIERMNTPDRFQQTLRYMPKIRYAVNDDSVILQSIVCDLMGEGVVAIFGPSSKASSTDIVASICAHYSIPHILFDVKMEESPVEAEQHPMTINFYPDIGTLSKLFSRIVHSQSDWNSYTVMYDSQEGLSRLQDVIHLRPIGKNSIRLRFLEDATDTRILWKDVYANTERRVIIDCSPSTVLEVLRTAKNFNMTGMQNVFLLTHLETNTVNFDEFLDEKASFKAIRLATNLNEHLEAAPVRSLILSDAVTLLTKTLYHYHNQAGPLVPPILSCEGSERWDAGIIIINDVKNFAKVFSESSDSFYTKEIMFDEWNNRVQFGLEVFHPTEPKKHPQVWDSIQRAHKSEHYGKTHKEETDGSLKGAHLKVATRLGPPYCTKIPSNMTGGSGPIYEGYAVDLIRELAENLDFQFTIEPVQDNQYGTRNSLTNDWDGIIGKLIANKADLGICDLTITHERREVVDFTVPFMSLGISILFYKNPPEAPNLFAFLLPFGFEVWMYTATTTLLLSFLLYIIARISKNEWENPHPCNGEPEELENSWNLANTSWLTTSSIMGQGCDMLPKSGALRLITGMWWFFALMMVNSYTANLAAFLTSSRIPSAIGSIEDLADQAKIKFGTVYSGSTRTFFKDSNDSVYRSIFAKMENAKPSVYTKDNIEGLDRVKKEKGRYAFLMETTSLQYLKERNCEVTEIGNQIGEKHYGIAVPLGSRYRSELNVEILKLSEKGKLRELKQKWWTAPEKCPTYENLNSAELSVENLGGVFLILGSGILVAFLIGAVEFLWNIRQIAVDTKVTPWEALKEELTFACKFWILKKPVRNENSVKSPSGSKRSSKSRSQSLASIPVNKKKECA